MKKIFFEASAFMQKIDFLKFYVINTSDNLPFQPYYSNPHVISFQKMHVLSVVQFMPKKMSVTGLCMRLDIFSIYYPVWYNEISYLIGQRIWINGMRFSCVFFQGWLSQGEKFNEVEIKFFLLESKIINFDVDWLDSSA